MTLQEESAHGHAGRRGALASFPIVEPMIRRLGRLRTLEP
jgi:hypothetical protein